MEDIQILRQKLDRIDGEIIALLEERLSVARDIADWKAARNLPVLDPSREEKVLASRSSQLRETDLREHVRRIFADIMAMSRAEQEKRITEDNNV